MEDDDRPNPNEFLESFKASKGNLKIFLGMAAGVGKTYSMLESAQKQKKGGVDLVVGIVETHGRCETAALLEGLKVLSRKQITYKNLQVGELDIDQILLLKPSLVIIDELAHSNTPLSRHPKRWQDVLEILENGIDVYTTLNVQHIESLKEIVERVSGIPVRETVPDSIIETASSIEVIDITPKDLLQRLREGKVYLGEQQELATAHFFQEDRLTALREVVLRFSAGKVDHDLHEMKDNITTRKTWKVREYLMVAVSASVFSQRLIRTAKRLAFSLDALWIAIHVDDGKSLDENETTTLEKNLSLARELGAEVITTYDSDIAAGIERIARQKNITQIILGRSTKRSIFNPFQRFFLLDKLTKRCGDIDVHVIHHEHQKIEPNKKISFLSFFKTWTTYLFVLCFMLALTGVNLFFLPYIGYKIAGFIFLLGVVALSLRFRWWAILFASILYALLWDTFFIPSADSLMTSAREDRVLFFLYVLTGLVVGIVMDRFRMQRIMLARREERLSILYQIFKEIASAPSSKYIKEIIKTHLERILDGHIEIITKKKNLLEFKETSLAKDKKEQGSVYWVFKSKREAGVSTSTLPLAKNLYLPLIGFSDIMGVLAFHSNSKKKIDIEEKNFLYTVCKQFAIYLERECAEEQIRQMEHVNEIEKIHQTILKLISQSFKEPLLGIQSAVKELKVHKKEIGIQQIHKIERFSVDLTKILDNMAVMNDLSRGIAVFNKKKNSIEKLVKASIGNIQEVYSDRYMKLEIEENLPLVQFDFSFIRLLLYNLIINAIECSDSIIEVHAKKRGSFITLSVLDEGIGIPEDQLDTIFEKFYRIPGRASKGVGLGLSIAKAIAKIHDGYLIAENRPSKGAKITFFLPL
ncbi:MAG: ATP-binding protein [Chlamydiales bacterium]|nr:ATP-binding protein [Chlamydiales bacterium]